MSRSCSCTHPPGEHTCDSDEIAICRSINGICKGRCLKPDSTITKHPVRLVNWVAQKVAGAAAKSMALDEKLALLHKGEYESKGVKIQFTLPKTLAKQVAQQRQKGLSPTASPYTLVMSKDVEAALESLNDSGLGAVGRLLGKVYKDPGIGIQLSKTPIKGIVINDITKLSSKFPSSRLAQMKSPKAGSWFVVYNADQSSKVIDIRALGEFGPKSGGKGGDEGIRGVGGLPLF